MLRRSLAAAVCAIFVAAGPAHAQLFDFDGPDSPVGTTTPFSLTRGGLTATFLGTPNQFSVTSGFFSTSTGNVLLDADPDANTLEIQFSAPRTSLGLFFALNDPSNTAVLQMNLFNGGGLVGSVTGSGVVPGGFTFPEGALAFSGAAFDHVFLFATGAPDFAIDDVRLGPTTAVPEPATVALLAPALLAVGGVARRRRRLA